MMNIMITLYRLLIVVFAESRGVATMTLPRTTSPEPRRAAPNQKCLAGRSKSTPFRGEDFVGG